MLPACSPLMITRESDVERISTLSLSTQSQNCRVVVRKLLERHTKEEIRNLIEEESSLMSTNLAFSSSYAGHDSDNADSAHQSPDRINAMVAPLIHSGSQLQSHAFKPIRSLNIAISPEKTQERNNAKATAFLSMTQHPRFICSLCTEESITKTCGRRNDLRRHIEGFHNSNAVWFCQHPGCKMAFDWRAAYQSHLRDAHDRSQMNMADAMVKLCPQMVFACGFENCCRIFEAPSDDDTTGTLKEYSHHIVKHLGEGLNGRRWTYSARMHNLLRQSHVLPAWDNSLPEPERSRLRWYPQSSLILRKLLEARHLENLPSLIQFAIMLGSNPTAAKEIVGRLELPVKMKCACDHAAFPNIQGGSTHGNGEQDSRHLGLSRGTSLDYRLTGVIIPRQYVPRSVEPFNAIQSPEYGEERCNDPETINVDGQVDTLSRSDLGCVVQHYSQVPHHPNASHPVEMGSGMFVHDPTNHLFLEDYNYGSRLLDTPRRS